MVQAAGMAFECCRVFTYSIANFSTFRCAKQIRNDVDYHKLPVTLVAVGDGVAYVALGYSHHAGQDYALMRCMPNMLIAAPGDPMEVRACMRSLANNPQPSYLRLGKAGAPCFHLDVPEVEPGLWLKVSSKCIMRDNKILLTIGPSLKTAMIWLGSESYADHHVYSLPLWGQSGKLAQILQVTKATSITTMEDHFMDGGVDSWLLESVANEGGMTERIRIVALDSSVCGMVGSQSTL